MRDLCEKTGVWIEGDALTKQRISRVLLTKRGSKPVLRNFGSDLRSLVDLPFKEFKIHATQEIFQRLEKYVPEFFCESVEYGVEEGKISILVKGESDRRKVEYALSSRTTDSR